MATRLVKTQIVTTRNKQSTLLENMPSKRSWNSSRNSNCNLFVKRQLPPKRIRLLETKYFACKPTHNQH
jgi:hypothetical protein